MRLLVVEDENDVRGFLIQGLTEAGYAVNEAEDGLEGFQYASSIDFDLIVLDIMLPKLDGLSLLRDLRGRGVKTPVLLLTARDGVRDRVGGLDSGADDYLVKPFEFSELLARIRALLRRPPLAADPILRVDDLELDTVRHTVRRGHTPITLTPREFGLLEFLMVNAGQVLSRTQMIEHVWDVHFAGDTNVVDVYIGYLRKKIDQGFERALIETVRGFGYRMAAGDNHAP
ncbi:MAG: response regulator transcription factor [Anaerolineales bacterium]